MHPPPNLRFAVLQAVDAQARRPGVLAGRRAGVRGAAGGKPNNPTVCSLVRSSLASCPRGCTCQRGRPWHAVLRISALGLRAPTSVLQLWPSCISTSCSASVAALPPPASCAHPCAASPAPPPCRRCCGRTPTQAPPPTQTSRQCWPRPRRAVKYGGTAAEPWWRASRVPARQGRYDWQGAGRAAAANQPLPACHVHPCRQPCTCRLQLPLAACCLCPH